MNNYNLIGDIGGCYKTLLALLEQMPKDATPVALGDLNDRGPLSNEVIEFFRTDGLAVNSNHGDFMVDTYLRCKYGPSIYKPRYHKSDWFSNGGLETMNSYDPNWALKCNLKINILDAYDYRNRPIKMRDFDYQDLDSCIPEEHIKYLKELPFYIEGDNFFLSHAPLHAALTKTQASTSLDMGLLWNRDVPKRAHRNLNNQLSIFGHNASDHIKIYNSTYPLGLKVKMEEFNLLKEDKNFEINYLCIDTSFANKLTGLHLPTMTIYQQDWIDDLKEKT